MDQYWFIDYMRSLYHYLIFFCKPKTVILTSLLSRGWVAQLVGALSHTPKRVRIWFRQGTYLGCGSNPLEPYLRQSIGVSLLSLSLFPSSLSKKKKEKKRNQ